MLYVYFVAPTLTMMHLCTTQCTYWPPLYASMKSGGVFLREHLKKRSLKFYSKFEMRNRIW